MFAGRYLYWMLMCVAQFMFFAMCFDYFTWVTLALSGCTRTAGACGPIIMLMSGTIKPMGLWLAGCVVLLLTVARTCYLSMSLLWAPVVLVWIVASAPFPMLLGNLAAMNSVVFIEALSPAFLFLAAFIAYLVIPFEENDGQPLGSNGWVRLLVWLSAIHCTLTALAGLPQLGSTLAQTLGVPGIAGAVAFLQPRLAFLLSFGTESSAPAYAALAMFVIGLAASRLVAGGPEAEAHFTGLEAPRESRD